MLTPRDFGLPDQFTKWRAGQYESVDHALNSDKRFITMCAPTGWGKSLFYMALAKMTGFHTAILTSTKGLQDQLERDFSLISADIRGQNAYRCPIATSRFGLPSYTPVVDAPCQYGYQCDLRKVGCEYYDKYRLAQCSDIVVTNYACWFFDQMRKSKLDAMRNFHCLVLDEAHNAPEALAEFLGTELERKDVLALGMDWPRTGFEQADWREWGGYWLERAEQRVTELEAEMKNEGHHHPAGKELKKWKAMRRKMQVIASMKGEWIIEEKEGMKVVHFDVLWPRHYAESNLFRGVNKIILVSATVRPKTAELLGISSDQLDFRELPSTFPRTSRPTIHVPTVQMNYRTDDTQLMWWLRRIDQIIEARKDRKGIIHTVSYARAKLIFENSRYSSMMLMHDSKDARHVIRKFKESSKPLILLSPSVSTGYDFPYEQCEYQIIGKMPFPDMKSKILKARQEQDKQYTNYLCMQQLIQSVGRGMRAKDDQCETIIIDDNVGWFMKACGKQFAPRWFLESFSSSQRLPPPLPKLQRTLNFPKSANSTEESI